MEKIKHGLLTLKKKTEQNEREQLEKLKLNLYDLYEAPSVANVLEN